MCFFKKTVIWVSWQLKTDIKSAQYHYKYPPWNLMLLEQSRMCPLMIKETSHTLKAQYTSITFPPSDITDLLLFCVSCSLCLSLQIPDQLLLKGQWPNICALAQSSDRSAAEWYCAWKKHLTTHIHSCTVYGCAQTHTKNTDTRTPSRWLYVNRFTISQLSTQTQRGVTWESMLRVMHTFRPLVAYPKTASLKPCTTNSVTKLQCSWNENLTTLKHN